jgi:hypothetical protein
MVITARAADTVRGTGLEALREYIISVAINVLASGPTLCVRPIDSPTSWLLQSCLPARGECELNIGLRNHKTRNSMASL